MINSHQFKLRLWGVSILLAFATSFGSFVTLSLSECCNSEESKVCETELVELEVAGEEKIVQDRRRRVRRRSIVARRSDWGQLHIPSKSEVATLAPPLRCRHNGCGSHLRI